MEANTHVETLDISFNNIGGGHNDNKWAHILKNAFAMNQTLVHIDMSFCSFNLDEIIIINEGLSENHTSNLWL